MPLPPPRGFDDRLRAKDVVTGICRDGQSKVYPLAAMPDGAVINDRLDDLNHVVLFDSTSQTAITYSRELDGEGIIEAPATAVTEAAGRQAASGRYRLEAPGSGFAQTRGMVLVK